MLPNSLLVALLVEQTFAFPWVADAPGVNAGLLRRQQTPPPNSPGSAKNCPFNPNHVPAAPVTAKYPYNNAKNGQKGNEKGNYQACLISFGQCIDSVGWLTADIGTSAWGHRAQVHCPRLQSVFRDPEL